MGQSETNKKVYDYLKENYPSDCLQWTKTVEWKLDKEVPLKDIQMARRPGGARETDKVKGIAQAVKEGKPMEPVVLVRLPDRTIKIADGYHRTLAFRHAGKKTIKAWIASVPEQKGAWDKEMHEKKLNIGKKAYDEFLAFVGFEKVAIEIPDLGGNIFNKISQLDDVANLAIIAQKKRQQAAQPDEDGSVEKKAFFGNQMKDAYLEFINRSEHAKRMTPEELEVFLQKLRDEYGVKADFNEISDIANSQYIPKQVSRFMGMPDGKIDAPPIKEAILHEAGHHMDPKVMDVMDGRSWAQSAPMIGFAGGGAAPVIIEDKGDDDFKDQAAGAAVGAGAGAGAAYYGGRKVEKAEDRANKFVLQYLADENGGDMEKAKSLFEESMMPFARKTYKINTKNLTASALLSGGIGAGIGLGIAHHNQHKEASELISELSKTALTDNQEDALGGTAIVGGGYAVNKSVPLIDGMERLYHGTSKENGRGIRENGLLGSKAGEGVVTKEADLEGRIGKDALSGKVYLTRDQSLAQQVAMRQAKFRPTQMDVIKAKIPYRHFQDGTLNEVPNPELRGMSKEEWIKVIQDEVRQKGGHVPGFMLKGSYDALDSPNTRTIAGDLGTEYIQGSQDFKGQDLKGLMDYVEHHPGRFAGGLGLAGLGLAGIGLGGAELYHNHFQGEKE